MFAAGCADKSKEDATKERIEQLAGGTLSDVVAVRGTVFIDGAAAEGVNLMLFKSGAPQQVATTRTDADGKYCWSTYGNCDGIPAGEYSVAFTHIPKPKKNDSGVDLLKGKYANSRSSKFKLVVENGKPQETVNYELETK
ncbi:MAG: carboxypeptidase regulatory-like domain-containing protein [Planctomycetaceae bacterium]|nr:carboxypeptidase regulatory-like domain-containing protein [Planctomycetaceae bacterium]